MTRHSWWKQNSLEKWCRACGMHEEQIKLGHRSYEKMWSDASGNQVDSEVTPPCRLHGDSWSIQKWIDRMLTGEESMERLNELREQMKVVGFDYRREGSSYDESDVLRVMADMLAETDKVASWFEANPEFLHPDLTPEKIRQDTQRFLQIGTISMNLRNGVKVFS